MAIGTVSALKFVGTVSLGLLTGVSYTLSTQTLPALLTLATATTCATTFLNLQTLAKRHLRTLTALTISSYTLAFTLSPSRIRHPYLIWISLVAGAGMGVDYFLPHDEDGLRETIDEAGGDDENINGEMVRMGVEKMQFAQMVRTGVTGLGFLMGVVGIQGEGLD